MFIEPYTSDDDMTASHKEGKVDFIVAGPGSASYYAFEKGSFRRPNPALRCCICVDTAYAGAACSPGSRAVDTWDVQV